MVQTDCQQTNSTHWPSMLFCAVNISSFLKTIAVLFISHKVNVWLYAYGFSNILQCTVNSLSCLQRRLIISLVEWGHRCWQLASPLTYRKLIANSGSR